MKTPREIVLQQRRFGLIFLMPWIVTFCVFWLYPLLKALHLSFTEYQTLTGQERWVGLANYTAILHDTMLLRAARNTLLFTIGTVPLTTALATVFALLLDGVAQRPIGKLLRAAYFLPTVTSLVVISLIFTNLYARDGYVNMVFATLGLPYPDRGWLLEPVTALPSIMAMDVWMATGYYAIIVLAGLQTIPRELYDAARLHGANWWDQVRLITLPLLRPTLTFVIVMNTIKSFQVFVEIYIMTRGGPLEGTTTTLVYEIYRNAFERTDGMGYAAAIAYVVFLLLVGISWLQVHLAQRKTQFLTSF